MKCPLCAIDLLMTERQGVEIDHCPRCRGVWLDRGELDKIIDRTHSAENARDSSYSGSPYDRPRPDDDRRPSHGHGYSKQKKRGFLDDLFDFD